MTFQHRNPETTSLPDSELTGKVIGATMGNNRILVGNI